MSPLRSCIPSRETVFKTAGTFVAFDTLATTCTTTSATCARALPSWTPSLLRFFVNQAQGNSWIQAGLLFVAGSTAALLFLHSKKVVDLTGVTVPGNTTSPSQSFHTAEPSEGGDKKKKD